MFILYKPPKILGIKLLPILRCVSQLGWDIMTPVSLLTDCSCGTSRITLAKYVLTLNRWNMTRIVGNVLQFVLMIWPSYPILGISTPIAIDLLIRFVCWG